MKPASDAQSPDAADLRRRFVACLGRTPESAELAPRVERRERGDGYTRELVSFAASPGVRVPAWVLIPDGLGGPAPAVLVLHQHNGEYHLGKNEPVGLAGNRDVAFAHELAQRGFVCIAPDMEAFEDRRASAEDHARWRAARTAVASSYGGPDGPRDGDYERFVATKHILEGSSLQARYTFDARRTIDYLVTRPEIDPTRIGAIGHSLGGQQTVWALAADARLRCGVSSCGISTLATMLRDGINHNFACYAPGVLAVGDLDALVASLAPTPLMLATGATDILFPIDGVRRIGAVADAAYRAAGAGDAFRLLELDGGHAAPEAARREMYAWLTRWLAPAARR
ncbi:MAG TPA: prolyl oligopeptidase family serine peptidase [Planctomycetota bacterium]|nr:prolyl oligopeptidase family serine peptidase [Planctomycetota bacterium]